MNKVILMGRLVRDPDVKYANGGNSGQMCIASYTLAVDRRFRKEGEATADFLRCVSFGKAGEFAEKYFKQGTKVAVTGRLQTGSYKNRDGATIYTTDVVINSHTFCEKAENKPSSTLKTDSDGFESIPDKLDELLPFS